MNISACASLPSRYCIKCHHARMSHFSFFNRKIVSPIQKYGYLGEGREAMRTLKEDVLERILLRRTKLERAEDVKLPPLAVMIRRDTLSPAERDFYEGLYKQTRTQFDTYVEAGTLLHNYAHIFDLISRLRQAVDHPYLIIYGNLAPPSDSQTLSLDDVPVIPAPGRSVEAVDVCGICQDEIDKNHKLATAACKHVFHDFCIREYVASAPVSATTAEEGDAGGEGKAGAPTLGCPVCYSPLTVTLLPAKGGEETANVANEEESDEDEDDGSLIGDPGRRNNNRRQTFSSSSATLCLPQKKKRGILSRVKTSMFKSSTKVEALVQEMNASIAEDPEGKCIIFSQFVSMLDIIEWRLKKGGIPCVKLIGSLSLASRWVEIWDMWEFLF